MNQDRITQLAKEAGLVQGPWANGAKERIWQENRDFPDALEMFAMLVAEECIRTIEERHKLALEFSWDVEDTLNDIKQEITNKFKIE